MPTLAPFLSSINSGEFSPRMDARVDFERYPNAAKRCRNFTLLPQGGITRRPGTRFVKEVKDSSLSTILIPFEYSEDDAYVLEAGNNYFRFYRRQGRIDVVATDTVIVNGTFTAGITSWTDTSTGTAAIAHDATNGRLQLTGASGSIAWARQQVSVAAGDTAKVHVLKFRIAGYGGGKVGFQVGTTTTGAEVLSEVMLEPGEHSIEFTPGATTIYVQFRNANAPVRNMFIDNVEFIDDAALELVSPFGTSDLSFLQYFQAADLVYVCSGEYIVRKIERRGHRSWSIVEVFFKDGPYLEINDGEDYSVYQIITNSLFDNGLQGYTDNSAGDAFLVYNEAGKFAELDPGTSSGSGNAIMRTTGTTVSGKRYVAHILILAAGPVTVKFGTTAGGSEYTSNPQQPGWLTYQFTASAATLHIEFAYAEFDAGRAGVGGCIVYSQDARLMETSAISGSAITLSAVGFTPFTSDDVGRLIRLEHPGSEPGYGVITGFTSTSAVTVLVLRNFATTALTENWRFGAFGGIEGHPSVIAFFDGRLGAANTEGQPNSIWLSQSGKLEDMRPDTFADGASTVEADDAIAVTLRSTKLNPVYWMAGQRQLMVGTAGGEWVIQSSGAVITPTDLSAKEHAAVPCAAMRSISINQTILFADRSRREVHDLGFSLQEDSFLATDLTILSDHVFRSNIQDMVYQRNPYSTIWCRRSDGRLVSLSYNKQHQILGWSQSIIGGSFGSGDSIVESIATIPGNADAGQQYPSDERNELWMIVKRTIDGQTKRYIEFMEYHYNGPLREDYETEKEWSEAIADDQADAFYVDCGLTYDGAAITTITGLDHLEGETVKILADGVIQPDREVLSGTVTINNAATKIQIGLGYKHQYEGLKIGVASEGGGGVNKVKIISSVGLVLLDSTRFSVTTVEYDDVSGRRQNELYEQDFLQDSLDPINPIPLFTGEVTPSTEGVYSRDSRIYIEGDDPLPFTLLGLAPVVEVRTE